jgi:hypothetical protein
VQIKKHTRYQHEHARAYAVACVATYRAALPQANTPTAYALENDGTRSISMKLSPDKVEQLAANLVDKLAEIDGVLFKGDDGQLRLAAQQVITDELMVEEQLDAEIHKMLQAYKYEITMGRMNYDELFKKTKQRMVKERKLTL